MTRKAISIAVPMLLCALLPAAAGCGGKKSTTPTASGDTGLVPTAPTTATTTAANASGRSKAQCLKFAQAVADAQTQLSQGLTGNIFKGDPLGDAASFRGSDIWIDAKTFSAVAAKTPASIKPAFTTIETAFSQMGNALKGINLTVSESPDAAAQAQLQQFVGKVDRPKLEKAETEVATWMSTSCHYY